MRDDLLPRADNGAAPPPPGSEGGDADRGQRADVLGADELPSGDDPVPFGEVIPARADVLAGRNGGAKLRLDRIATRPPRHFDVLDAHYRVESSRNWRASHDLHRAGDEARSLPAHDHARGIVACS